MPEHRVSVSGARILAGTSALFGVALLLILLVAGGASPIVWLFLLPFLVVLVASIASIPALTRAIFIWIASAAAIFPAALTIFSGVGFFLAAIIVAWLVAAWQESRVAR